MCDGHWTDQTPPPIPQLTLQSTDATVWAAKAMELFPQGMPPDEALLIAWFANAIETGFDQGRRAVVRRRFVDLGHAHVTGLVTGALDAAPGLHPRSVAADDNESSAEIVVDLPFGAPVPHVHLLVLPPNVGPAGEATGQ